MQIFSFKSKRSGLIIQRVKIPYERKLRSESLVSRKLVFREDDSEGSETTKVGTDEQESHMRHRWQGKQAQHCKAPKVGTKKAPFM